MLSLNAQEYFESRAENRAAFLRAHVSDHCTLALVAQDWASRRYFRVHKENGQTVILMEAIPDHTGAFTPGHKISDFIRIDRALHQSGINVPEIFAMDEYEGYVLLEDFGDLNAYDLLERGGDAHAVYTKATDILISLRDTVDADALSLPDYYTGHVHKGRQRLVDWYMPATRRAVNPDGLVESYLAAWEAVERSLPPCPAGFVHGDFHIQNLMATPSGALGVLDFQGAMRGPMPYDLANLLEDIRRDVPRDIRAAMIARYAGDETFMQWYRVVATQFHCRILGQTLRLAIAGNRPDFLKYIPRVQGYIKAALSDPVLLPLAQWMKDENVDLDAAGCFDPEFARPFIRPDAF